jgi:hypothetical protein
MRIFVLYIQFFLLSLPILANSQNYEKENINDTIPINCPLFEDNTEASQIILSILDHTGVCPNFEIRNANVSNAKAVIRDNQRLILYNEEYIRTINQKGRTNWAGIGVLAHEIGHHLNGHTIYFDRSDYEAELEADNFAGFILRKMGASLSQAQSAINAVSKEKSTKTHPGKSTRLVAIEAGWQKADKQIKRLNKLSTVSDIDTGKP